MTTQADLPHRAYTPDMAAELLELWHRATDGRFPITPQQWQASTAEDPQFRPEDSLVLVDGGRPVAFLLGKRFRCAEPGCRGFLSSYWISLLAVTRERQGSGLGRLLLQEAGRRAGAAGASSIWLGGDFAHFAPGLPEPLAASLPWFLRQGFAVAGECWDVARDLEGFQPPAECATSLAAADAAVRPFQAGEEPQLLALLAEGGFSPRWRHDAGQWLAAGGEPGRFLGLWRGDNPVGFAWIHPPSSDGARRWQGWQPRITALGPIGVASSQRGKGLGLALLAGALGHLQSLGARQTVIDWTDLLDFYGRLGFRPWIRYTRPRMELQTLT